MMSEDRSNTVGAMRHTSKRDAEPQVPSV
jgi:hypothetical protein